MIREVMVRTPVRDDEGFISEILAVARRHLRMDVAFISEFVGDRSVFRYVDPPDNHANMIAGGSMPLSESYCKRIVDGEFPEIIPDTDAFPPAKHLPITDAAMIGAHIGVPLQSDVDGPVYGTFCCFSRQADRLLNVRDHEVMRALADVAAQHMARRRNDEQRRNCVQAVMRELVSGPGLDVVFQPIISLEDRRVVGLEALARFSGFPGLGPDKVFADADTVGMLVDLELAAIRKTLAVLPQMPRGLFCSVNVSPRTIVHAGFQNVFPSGSLDQIVLEITEHADVSDYATLEACLAPLRARRLRVAIDDAGAGYSSLQHILNIKPNVIKLDMGLTRNVDSDPVRRSLASALVGFAREVGCDLVAEGVETDAELEALQGFGVRLAQGFRLCRPMPLAQALDFASRHRTAAKAGEAPRRSLSDSL